MKIKIGLIEVEDNLLKIIPINIQRFNGSLFAMEKEEDKTYWDVLYIVGIAALLRT